MEVRLNRLALHIDWLMLLFPCIAAALGEGRRTLFLLLSLFLHESGHILAARMLHVRINRLRLTPFGAMAHIDNPYSISTSQLFLLSLAGPAANLIVVLTVSAMCHWRLLPLSSGLDLLQINLTMLLFNLLPALPLDGGRMMYALLTRIMPDRRAAETGILTGRLLSLLLLVMAAAGILVKGRLNLSPVFAALFLLASAPDERRALSDSRIRTLVDCLRPIDEPLPVSIFAINTATSAETALKAARPNHVTLFAVYDQGHFSTLIDDRTILTRILNHPK